MENNGQPFLSHIIDLLGLTQDAASSRQQQLGVTVGINIGRNLADNRAGKVAVQAIYQHGFQYRSFKDDMIFSCGHIQVGVVTRLRGRGLGLGGGGLRSRGGGRSQLLLRLRQQLLLLGL